MPRRTVVVSTAVLIAALGLTTAGAAWWATVLVLVGVAASALVLTTCRHSGPLALLPPTMNADGSSLPARWYCDRCGRAWPAKFERPQTPVVRFAGYDETKAVSAARRAGELADRQRTLALERAGLKPAARAASRSASAESADVVALRPRREMAR